MFHLTRQALRAVSLYSDLTAFKKCSENLQTNLTISKLLPCTNQISVRLKSKEDEACVGCRRALVDIPEPVDEECPLPTEKRKKPGILYKMKLKMIDGGANFGTPFWRKKPKKKKAVPAKVDPKPTLVQVPEPRPGVHVTVLGAESSVGQYLALLLKQCLAIKKLKLYEATCPKSNRDAYVVAQDLKHIDTNCMVQAFSCGACELELCVENSDIVVMLNLPNLDMCLPYCQRFAMQAPYVKMYTEAISRLCPRAFIIVATSPVDCMTPLISEVLKGNGYYNNRKLMGSMALQEMRASTLAGNALCLDPNITRVPCVGGTEGEGLVPLFSKALEKFEFTEQIMTSMTNTLRDTSCKVKDCFVSEAYALAKLVNSIAHALTCMHVPKISAFVEPDPCTTMTPTRFMANKVDINRTGIIENYGLPLLSDQERFRMDIAMVDINNKTNLAKKWYAKNTCAFNHNNRVQKYFYSPREYAEFKRCRI